MLSISRVRMYQVDSEINAMSLEAPKYDSGARANLTHQNK